MKRHLAVLLALLLLLALTACGGGTESTGSAAHTHSYESKVTKEPTCVADGVKTHTCTCGDSYTEAVTSTGKHAYASQVTTKETCINAGLKTFTCSFCGDSYTEILPATGKHNHQAQVTTKETCAADGVQTFACTMCGDSFTQTIPATGKHNYAGNVTTAATCTEDGVKTFVCAGCGDSYTEIIPGGHKWTEATCTAAKVCQICSKTSGEPLGHTTNSGTCSRCGQDVFKPLVYSGKGDKVVTGVNLPKGPFYVEYTHDGRSNFIVDLYYDANSSDSELVANDLRECSGRKLINTALSKTVKNGMLEVNADGNWTIKIERIEGTTSTNISGEGDWVVGYFTATQARNVCTYTHNGRSNIIVDIYNPANGDSSMAVNDLRECSGSRVVTLSVGQKYFFSIRADGAWTLDLGLGDPLERQKAPEIPSSGSGSGNSSGSGSSSGSSGADDEKWSFSEASKLNEYATNATRAMNDCAGYINDGFKAGALQAMYYNMGVARVSTAISYLEGAERLVKENASLELTSGEYATVLDKIEATLVLARAFAERNISADNLPDYTEISGAAMKIYTLCLSIQSNSVELMNVFN